MTNDDGEVVKALFQNDCQYKGVKFQIAQIVFIFTTPNSFIPIRSQKMYT